MTRGRGGASRPCPPEPPRGELPAYPKGRGAQMRWRLAIRPRAAAVGLVLPSYKNRVPVRYPRPACFSTYLRTKSAITCCAVTPARRVATRKSSRIDFDTMA